jgi:hypothetical protein
MKSLITITTCNRLSEVKKYIWEYLQFVNRETDFDFVLALDGHNQEYIDFAAEFELPLIYSDEREGVGLSKNRVLSYFPNYDFYFFIEDDIELLTGKVFHEILRTYHESGIHHFCNNHKNTSFDNYPALNLSISWTGGAQLAFYSQEGIRKVGGFHTLFAKYKRYGHTEHTYRYFHQELQRGPFIFADHWYNFFLIHSPQQVTTNALVEFNKNGIIKDEQELIDARTTYFALQTLSPYHFNNKPLGYNQTVADFLSANPQKYPLTKGKGRRVALAEHYALRIPQTSSFFKKIALFLKSVRYSPTNVALKHYIKTQLFGRRNR